jgi:hypothetical protein
VSVSVASRVSVQVLTGSSSGSYYSSSKDFLALGSAILRSQLLPPATTRAWMKPKISTSSTGTQIGAPWEIYRSDNLTADGRLIEVYTKSGNLASYNAMLALVPDYNITVAVLAAGNETSEFTVTTLMSGIIQTLLPELERIGRDNSAEAYENTYRDVATNSTLIIDMDDGPGLNVKSLVIRGVDILAIYSVLSSYGAPGVDVPATARLYPTNVGLGARQSWRAIYNTSTAAELATMDNGLFWKAGSCLEWDQLDRLAYQYKSIDEFVFTMKGGKAAQIELPAFQVTLQANA